MAPRATRAGSCKSPRRIQRPSGGRSPPPRRRSGSAGGRLNVDLAVDHDDAVAIEQEQRHEALQSVLAGRGDGIVLNQLMAGIAAGVRRRQVAARELLLQLLLARHNALAQRPHVEAGLARLG